MTTSLSVDKRISAARREPTLNVYVERIRDVADGVVSLSLVSVDGRPLPPWEPGAHIDLQLAEGLVRQYSLCGDPDDTMRWQIAVLRVPDSRGGSEWIHTRLREGDRLRVRGPRNNFPLVPAAGYVFIAGGIGITPLLPMLKTLEARPGTKWQLFYGGRRRASMAFVPALERFGDKVTIWPEDECGLLDLDAILGKPQVGVAIYACGPESMLQAVERQCRSWPSGALHMERFQPHAGLAEDRLDEPFQVVAARSGVVVDVAADQTIVGALEKHGVNIPVSCGAGVCGTCITRVLDGIPDHRDAVLTEEERATGEVMTPCCSRAYTARIVLDV